MDVSLDMRLTDTIHAIARRLDDRSSFLYSFFHTRLVLLSSTIDTLDGVIGAFVTNAIVLTSAEWVADPSSIQWAVTPFRQYKVKNVRAANNTRPSSANSSDAADATTSYNGSLIFVEFEEQIDEHLAILNVPMPSVSQPTVDIFSLRYWDPFHLKVNEDLSKYFGELQPPEVCEHEDL